MLAPDRSRAVVLECTDHGKYSSEEPAARDTLFSNMWGVSLMPARILRYGLLLRSGVRRWRRKYVTDGKGAIACHPVGLPSGAAQRCNVGIDVRFGDLGN